MDQTDGWRRAIHSMIWVVLNTAKCCVGIQLNVTGLQRRLGQVGPEEQQLARPAAARLLRRVQQRICPYRSEPQHGALRSNPGAFQMETDFKVSATLLR